MYPKEIYDYLICRSQQKDSSWWDECVGKINADSAKIKACVFSKKGEDAMRKHTQLTQELKVASGPTFILDNKEIFGMANPPTLEELEKIVLNEEKKDK